jgi:transketolase
MVKVTDLIELQKIANKLRENVVRMIGVGPTGHIGGSCSAADIVAALYFYKMKHDPKNPGMPDRDRFILSKGHAAIIQYAVLAECGYFEKDLLYTLKTLGSPLQGHPDMRKLTGIEANTGSLGQGLSISAGIAAGLKMGGIDAKVYCMLGDGELAEGQVWEAALTAACYKLDNLVAIVDSNRIQATGTIEERYNTGSIADKFRAFGFEIIAADGHDMASILWALDQTDEKNTKPYLILAETVKGKGIPFAENTCVYHNGALSADQYTQALEALCECEKEKQI